MRRYDDPVEARMGQVLGVEAPEQFLWRGRLWKVRAVVAHWVETGPWWQSGDARAVIGSDEPTPASPDRDGTSSGDTRRADLLGERELWRVEAGRGAGSSAVEAGTGEVSGGVFDLAFDWNDGRWALVGCTD